MKLSELTLLQRAFISGMLQECMDRPLTQAEWKTAYERFGTLDSDDAKDFHAMFEAWQVTDSEVYGNAETECGNSDGNGAAVCTERCGSSV